MFKRCQVVMLPTEKASSMVLSLTDKKLKLSENSYFVGHFQNIYILNNEIADKGDYTIYHGKVYQVLGEKNTYIETDVAWLYPESNKLYKIIATTDKLVVGYIQQQNNEVDIVKTLPQPSEAFIKAYIEAYNNGNPITEVMIEFYDWSDCPKEAKIHTMTESNWGTQYVGKLKVDKNNTITIRKIKDSWNREEVVSLLKEYRNCVMNVGPEEIEYLNNFVKENL